MDSQTTSAPYFFDTYSLYRDLKNISNKIIIDFGGGSPLSKTLLMALLVLEHNLKNYVEIGIYRGKSLFPLAFAEKQIGGTAYGIDPYELEAAKEFDLSEEISQTVNTFMDEVNLPQMFVEVTDFQKSNNFSDSSIIIRKTSENAVSFFRDQHIEIDMLHIDGNHDTKFVQLDADLYIPLVRQGGFIVFDDINWPSVEVVFNEYKDKFQTIFNNGEFAILYKSSNIYSILSTYKLSIANSIVQKLDHEDLGLVAFGSDATTPIVSVIVPTYNHQKYIAECLDGILAQKGNFQLEVIIGDDFSTDETTTIINYYAYLFQQFGIKLDIVPSIKNLGVVKNYEKCLHRCSGNFIAFCEGDDFWIDCYKLQKEIDFLKEHPECSFCFNNYYFLFEEENKVERFTLQQNLLENVFETKSLVENNYIGNFSCCLYDSKYLDSVSPELFKTFTVDWLFNLYYSHFGKIGYINETLSVYRKHKNGVWTGKSDLQRIIELHEYIDDYNRILDFSLDKELIDYKRLLERQEPILAYQTKEDLIIYDDVFPNPLSPFRYQEFNSYLTECEKIKILCSGYSLLFFGKDNINDLLIQYKRKNPENATKVSHYISGMDLNAKLLYTVFLNNAYTIIDDIDKNKIPFVFTLYPGGGFDLNDEQSDLKLKRVTSSPFLKKVIVTQIISYNYLLDKGYCSPDQIEYIYGIVSPIDKITREYPDKKHFGYEKDSLDIVFGAHKYTPIGIDKGYDIFIKVAKKLSKEFNNIQFHVFGGFNENDIELSELKDRITFYGAHNIDWFDDFFRDKDIILSPNLSGMIHKGSFDGFPTGTCTEAALRETAIFCTDELNLNQHYIDGEDIVIVPHNQDRIVDLVKFYYNNPEKLRGISQKGRQKVTQLYGFESQILPRIKLVKEQILKSDFYAAQYLAKMDDLIKAQEDTIQTFNIQKNELVTQINEMSTQLSKKKTELVTKNNEIVEKNRELVGVYNSKAWKIALVFRKLRAILIPEKSFQMRLVKKLLRSRQKQNLKNDLYLINSSDLFNREWYLTQYPDIALSKLDPAKHYLLWGGKENRDPGPNFSTSYYLENNPDVQIVGINPLLHYLKMGKNEGRKTRSESDSEQSKEE